MVRINAWKRVGVFSLLCAAISIPAPAQTFNNLLSFDGSDGANPNAGLVQGTDGNFYGTTYNGGAHLSGTIFEITSSGNLTTLYSFCATTDCDDGQYPNTAPIQAVNGRVYGTTLYGGPGGNGTIFQISAAGGFTTLYTFCAQRNSQGYCSDGAFPYAGLVQATSGNFYGVTSVGGSGIGSYCTAYGGCGTVFEITAAGKLSTLYNFCVATNSQGYCPDGQTAEASLIQGKDGSFYGTTTRGGAYNQGTIFKITPSGKLTTLHSFCAKVNSHGYCTDGNFLTTGLVEGTIGKFYGVSSGGGATGWGTVFAITASGKFALLHTFCTTSQTCPDGGDPTGLVQATDGNLYGLTGAGGTTGGGTIFEITADGTLSTLYDFDDRETKVNGGLLQATDGTIYGTTYYGGANNDGMVFSLAVGLGPFVQARPVAGKVGATVIILGNELTGTSGVSFNGTAAKFTVVSGSEIRTTVPTAATSGTLEVTTLTGTLKSNVAFRVLP